MSKLEIIRGATYDQEINLGMDITGATVYFTAKPANSWKTDTDETDSTAVIQKDITSHSDPTNGKTRLLLESADTDITPNTYECDFHVKQSDGTVIAYQPEELVIKPSVTLRS